MNHFIPREKLGKKARKKLDSERRATWAFPPVTKKIDSKKRYDRKKNPHDRYDDYGMGGSLFARENGYQTHSLLIRM